MGRGAAGPSCGCWAPRRRQNYCCCSTLSPAGSPPKGRAPRVVSLLQAACPLAVLGQSGPSMHLLLSYSLLAALAASWPGLRLRVGCSGSFLTAIERYSVVCRALRAARAVRPERPGGARTGAAFAWTSCTFRGAECVVQHHYTFRCRCSTMSSSRAHQQGDCRLAAACRGLATMAVSCSRHCICPLPLPDEAQRACLLHVQRFV